MQSAEQTIRLAISTRPIKRLSLVSPSLPQQIRQELAFQSALAMGRCAPNPPVACVLATQESGRCQFIGGATEVPGKRHAEIVCLDRYRNLLIRGKLPREAPLRLYISLEPCSHQGRTPPCTQRILREPRLQRLLAWEADPLLKLSGIKLLCQNKRRASFLHQPSTLKPSTTLGRAFLGGFFSRANGLGPRLHLKAACSRDGIMGLRGQRLLISAPPALSFGHLLRAKLDAVVIGMGTIIHDRPRLDLRPKLLQPLSQEDGHKTAFCLSHGRDILCQTLLERASDLIPYISARSLEYQPDRIFLLGRYHQGFSAFLGLQNEVARHTHKPAVFLVEEPYLPLWRKGMPELDFYAILPSLQNPDFCKALRETLSQRNYNEVLIEGGAGLFLALQEGLDKEDRIYILRSVMAGHEILKKNAHSMTEPKNFVRLPAFMQAAPLLASYSLGQDLLEFRSKHQFIPCSRLGEA